MVKILNSHVPEILVLVTCSVEPTEADRLDKLGLFWAFLSALSFIPCPFLEWIMIVISFKRMLPCFMMVGIVNLK
jgi:hypothetical protein